MLCLVVVAATDDLLDRRSEYECLRAASACVPPRSQHAMTRMTYVLALRGVAALYVHERRVRLYDARLDEVVEAQKVLVVTEAVEVAAAKGEGAKVLCDGVEEGFGRGDAQRDVRGVGVLCVVRGFHLRVVSMREGVEVVLG